MVAVLKEKRGEVDSDLAGQLGAVWSSIDLTSSSGPSPGGSASAVGRVRRPGGGIGVSDSVLRDESSDCIPVKDLPLTPFEVARVAVALFSEGPRDWGRLGDLWRRLVGKGDLGFRRNRTSKDISVVFNQGKNRKA